MRVGFAGTPEFARVALARIIEAGFEVPLVLTQPDRPAGRGLQVQASAVKACATEHAIEVVQPRGLRLDGKYPVDAGSARVALEAARIDVLVVAAYGLILPAWVLGLPPHGCLNIHASLLPRWRGAAPIHRAIEAGDAETGVTIMQMDEGLDTGDMLLVGAMPIADDATSASLLAELAAMGGALIVDALQTLSRGMALTREPQPAVGVTYADKILKREAAIDWHAPAAMIERRLRAFDPFPGASSTLDGELVKCWRGEVMDAADGVAVVPGTVIEADARGIRVACGEQSLRLTSLQRAGGRRVTAQQWMHATSVRAGMRFDAIPT